MLCVHQGSRFTERLGFVTHRSPAARVARSRKVQRKKPVTIFQAVATKVMTALQIAASQTRKELS
jgi:hypothetical protein